MSETIKAITEKNVRTIQFNRPDKLNALTHEMYARIVEELQNAESDTKIRVIVFKGTPGCFTAGNDMQDFVQAQAGGLSKNGEIAPVTQFLQILPRLETPLVAVVDGLAVGVGVTMLMHCDLVYCSRRASFKTPFTALGLVPEAASSQLMPAAIGHQQAAELLMLSKTISAKDALRMGFVTRVFKTKALEKKATKQITNLAGLPPGSVRMAKKLMRRTAEPVSDRMDIESQEFSARLSSEEFTEAANAFMSRRKPDFSKFD